MGGRSGKGGSPAAAAAAPSYGLGEVLLFTTMCLVGLPVEVQVKDGSVYSGIFHTACVEKDYGIVLKKARKIVKGKCKGNLGLGASVDTLVVHSDDLVQVIAKGVLLPTERTVADVECNGVEAVTESVQSLSHGAVLARCVDQNGENTTHFLKASHSDTTASGVPIERTLSTKTLVSICEVENEKENGMEKIEEVSHAPNISVSERQAGECKPEEDVPQSNVYASPLQKAIFPGTFSSNPSINSIGDAHKDISTKTMAPVTSLGTVGTSDNGMAISRGISSSNLHTSIHSTSAMHAKTSSCASSSEMPTVSTCSTNPASSTGTKEFKLNPGAKTFSPSFANSQRVVHAVSTVANMGYVPNTYPVVPVATAQPTTEIGPNANYSSVQTKFIQPPNLAIGNTGPVSQFSHPVTGQPLRLSGLYNPVQTGPTYLLPNSQIVTVGRRGQVMYMHPVSQDAIQGIPTFTQVAPHPLLTPYSANPPKLQGTASPALQVCVTQPIFPSGQQLATMPVQAPLSNPLPSFQAIQVPVSGNFFVGKF